MVPADGGLFRATEKVQGHDCRPAEKKQEVGSKGKGQRKRQDERHDGTGEAGKRIT